MKLLTFPNGNASLTDDLRRLAATFLVQLCVAVHVGMIAGLRFSLVAVIVTLVVSITGGFVVSQGHHGNAQLRGLAIMVGGTSASLFAAYLIGLASH